MNYQEIFKSLLLRNIEIENLSLKGKLQNILFSTDNNGFGIKLNMTIDNKTKIVKIPVPFFIEVHSEDNLIYLDYRLSTIFHRARWVPIIPKIQGMFDGIENKNNKFFDTILELTYI